MRNEERGDGGNGGNGGQETRFYTAKSRYFLLCREIKKRNQGSGCSGSVETALSYSECWLVVEPFLAMMYSTSIDVPAFGNSDNMTGTVTLQTHPYQR